MRWLVAVWMVLFSAVASAQTLTDVLEKINTTLPTASSLTAANLRTVLIYMAGSNSLTSGLTSTINSNLPSGSALGASALRSTLQSFTSDLGLGTQLNTYINGAFASSDPAGISAAGLRQVLITLANAMFTTVQFTPLHTYFMAASGCNDTNAGTSSGSPWCTPNHAVVCGDVIIAAAGTYNGDFATWGTVSNCPSTSGGIDGTGGVYAAALLCGGSDIGSSGCLVNCGTGACNAGHGSSQAAVKAVMNNNSSYWAVIGWNGTGNGPSGGRGFQIDNCLTGTTQIHHIIYINNIINNANQGFNIDGCGWSGTTVPGNGSDYMGVVGNIAWNAAQDGICLGTIDIVGPSNVDTNAGTHMYIYGNHVLSAIAPFCRSPAWVTGTAYPAGCTTSSTAANSYCGTYVNSSSELYIMTSGACTSGATAPTGTGTGISDGGCTWSSVGSPGMNSDVEGILLDTMDGHNFTGQVVVANNLVWNNESDCIQEFFQNYHSGTPIVKIYNNSCYNNVVFIGSSGQGDGAGVEINTNNSNAGGLGLGIPWITTIQNNIVRNTHNFNGTSIPGNSGSTKHNVALVSGGNPAASNMTIGGTGTQNILLGSSSAAVGTCDTTNSACQFNSNSFGTNIYVNPNFANETDLNSNWQGQPNCNGFVSVTACMGYNVLTQTLTPHTPIADLTPTCSQCGGKGYQLPSSTCNTNADYPSYIKALNRLQVIQGTSTVIQVKDLVTVACGN